MSCDEIQVYQIPEVCFECDREAYVMCLVPCSIHACVCYDCIFVFWFAFLCIRMTSNPLRGCHCTGSFTVTLLLRTIRMHSQSQRSSLKGGSAVRRLNQPKPKTYFCREARGRPLQQCGSIRAMRLQAALLLRTTRMLPQRFGGVSGAAVL